MSLYTLSKKSEILHKNKNKNVNANVNIPVKQSYIPYFSCVPENDNANRDNNKIFTRHGGNRQLSYVGREYRNRNKLLYSQCSQNNEQVLEPIVRNYNSFLKQKVLKVNKTVGENSNDVKESYIDSLKNCLVRNDYIVADTVTATATGSNIGEPNRCNCHRNIVKKEKFRNSYKDYILNLHGSQCK